MARQTGVVEPISACDVLVGGLADEYDRSEAGLHAPDGKNHGGYLLSLSFTVAEAWAQLQAATRTVRVRGSWRGKQPSRHAVELMEDMPVSRGEGCEVDRRAP